MKTILRTLLFSALVSLCFYFSSCCKSLCLTAELFISFQNYTKAEADTIIVLGYQTNSNFTTRQDSNIVIKPYSANDTAKSPDFYSIYPDKDYIIKVPSVNKEFRFFGYEIIDQKCACENRKVPVLKSFKLNGVEHRDVYNFYLPR